jgi:hypothetical protein
MSELGVWKLTPGDFAGAMRARRAFVLLVRSIALPQSDIDGAELIFGEIAANGVEYGPATVTLALYRQGDELALAVHGGSRFADGLETTRPAVSDSRGRGLFFVRSVARRIEPSGRGGPTTVILPVRLS